MQHPYNKAKAQLVGTFAERILYYIGSAKFSGFFELGMHIWST